MPSWKWNRQHGEGNYREGIQVLGFDRSEEKQAGASKEVREEYMNRVGLGER